MIQRNLIVDVGMSEGNDTAYYLKKGFQVIGVEADPIAFATAKTRFAKEIDAGNLQMIHAAAGRTTGAKVIFWRNDTHQGLSSLNQHGQASEGGRQTSYEVSTVSWSRIVSLGGVPHYLKIDVEGAETPFLQSIQEVSQKPSFISAECHTFEPIQTLFELGYRRFKLVNQTILHTFPIPDPPLEGNYVPKPDWTHASGPFGAELPGEWLDFRSFMKIFEAVDIIRRHPTIMRSWFDCHAAL